MNVRICLGILFAVTVVAAQTQEGFEVASIRLNTSGEQDHRIRTPPGGRFTGTNVSVRTLILYAFDIKEFQLAGAPGWTDSERYDIDAKINANINPGGDSQATISPEGLRPLLRSLLATRFGLTFHRETKEVSAYALVAAKNGVKLHPNTGTPGHSTDWGKDHINAMDVTVTEFGRVIEEQLDRVVVDDTGIQGVFDFKLTWTPDRAGDTSGPSLFTAIQEQYGLKLESKKEPVEMVVIDRVDRPTEN